MPASSQSYTLPPAIGGWNARDALDLMAEQDAIRMVNVFPDVGDVKLRNGMRSWSTGMTGAVKSCFEYVKQDGTRQIMACANGTIWNATANGAATGTGTVGHATDIWSFINFNNVGIFVNGSSQPKQWDGSAISDATYTGVTDENLIHVSSYRHRLYFVEVDSASIWYGGVDSITGALTEFDVSGVLRKGGYLLWTGSWTRDKGSGSSDLFLACSNQGELLVYSGANPGATEWTLVGHFFLPMPLGRRSLVNLEGDVGILTELGLRPLTSILQDQESTITDKVRDAFRAAARNYRDNAGWDVIYYPRGNMLIVNVPIVSATTSEQYVMNTLTGAWCKFTGWNGFSWTLFNGKLYFGGAGGVLYEADYGSNDNGSAIDWDVKQAFSYLGDRARIKQLLMAKPLILGDSSAMYQFGIDVDFSNRTSPNPSITTTGTNDTAWGSPWGSPWSQNDVYNDKWTAISGIGRCIALRLSGAFEDAPFSLNATQLIYKTGGVL